ncbi:MAG: DNA alkylation repair protein [Actinobacteria bacterium]|nr:DNA alkylation repair protein [Actinomycetota bacterium]
MSDEELVATLRSGLRGLADPARAPQMQAYMKSAMPYLGVRVPQVRALVRGTARSLGVTDLRASVLALWDAAAYREERYAATELLNVPAARPLRRPSLLGLYEHLIVTGAWWDHVDEVAHRVGELLRLFPDEVRPTVARWPQSPDRWLRRTSVICQLGARTVTDLDLLTTAIDANADDPDFFLRKAVGWALREYAKTDPDWVRTFVAGRSLSPLSVREATKHLPPIS